MKVSLILEWHLVKYTFFLFIWQSGDQIIEINGRSTYGMTHHDAISLIRDGGLHVRLLLRKTNAPPPSLDGTNRTLIKKTSFIEFYFFLLFLSWKEVKTAMVGPIGNGIEGYNPGQSSHWQPSGYT